MTYLAIPFFAALMMIKGGWLKRIPLWKRLDDKLDQHQDGTIQNVLFNVGAWIIDGNNLSALILWAVAGSILPFGLATSIALAWWIFVISSMGEEAGAVGDYTGGWGPYVEHFDRKYGVKKALIHGISGGALLTIATGFIGFIFAGATFPICYFVGSSIYKFLHKQGSWAYAEPIYGAVFGIAAAYYIGAL